MGCLRPFRLGSPSLVPIRLAKVKSGPFVAPLELVELALRFLACNSITLLDLSNDLVTLALDHLPVIAGQSTPLFLGLSDQLLPVSLHLVAIHGPKSCFVNPAYRTAPSGFRFRRLWGDPHRV